jgi:type IX secretion system PorP/SprF family membrane protein
MGKLTKPILLFFFVFSSILNEVIAQEVYVQKVYVHVPTLINPSFSGINPKGRVNLWYQSQLLGLKNAPATRLLSVESPLLNGRIGVGMNLINDRNGFTGFNAVEFNGAYHIKFDKYYDEKSNHYLSFGLGFRASQYSIDLDVRGDGLDPRTNEPLMSGFVDFCFGSFYLKDGFFAGLSLYQLRRENPGLFRSVEEPKSRPLVYLMTGYEKEVNGIWIKPLVLLRVEENADLHADVQCGVGLTLANGSRIWGMPGFRFLKRGFQEGVSGMLNAGITYNALEFGYQWVYPMRGLFGQQTHGISLGYLFQFSGSGGGQPTRNSKSGKSFF